MQKELSQTSDEKMKSIIATIQKEQNQIIRNEKSGTLIIQGVAGSGKTSTALHRIAFLLYRFKNQLSAKNVAILSPNKAFGDYISNVIPELGEEPIYELNFYDIARIELGHVISFERDHDPLENHDKKWIQRVRFKSTLKFVALMDEYIKSLPYRIFKPVDYIYNGFIAKSQWIQKRFYAYERYPIKQRLSMVANDIYYQFQTDNIMPAKKTLEWTDVFPFLYLHSAFEGITKSKITKHLLIDEIQDYTPIQYAIINLLFPCQKTILGDFGQFLNPNHLHTLTDIRQLYNDAEYVELNKSYRSTFEIITFAKHIQAIESRKQ